MRAGTDASLAACRRSELTAWSSFFIPTALGRVHVAKIKDEFGSRRLDTVRPSEVKAWTVKLKAAGFSESDISALHQRMAQVYSDAVHYRLVARSPFV